MFNFQKAIITNINLHSSVYEWNERITVKKESSQYTELVAMKRWVDIIKLILAYTRKIKFLKINKKQATEMILRIRVVEKDFYTMVV